MIRCVRHRPIAIPGIWLLLNFVCSTSSTRSSTIVGLLDHHRGVEQLHSLLDLAPVILSIGPQQKVCLPLRWRVGVNEEEVDHHRVWNRQTCIFARSSSLVHLVNDVPHSARLVVLVAAAHLHAEERLHSVSNLWHPSLIVLLLEHFEKYSPTILLTKDPCWHIFQEVRGLTLQGCVKPQANLTIVDDLLRDGHIAIHAVGILLEALRVFAPVTVKSRCSWKVSTWSPLRARRLLWLHLRFCSVTSLNWAAWVGTSWWCRRWSPRAISALSLRRHRQRWCRRWSHWRSMSLKFSFWRIFFSLVTVEVLLVNLFAKEVFEVLEVGVLVALRHGRWSEHVDRNGTLPMQLGVFGKPVSQGLGPKTK